MGEQLALFDHFTNPAVQRLNRVGGINGLPYFWRVGKQRVQIVPVLTSETAD
jgi:hypothetical protein